MAYPYSLLLPESCILNDLSNLLSPISYCPDVRH
jgi:hypothetical protein